MDRKAENKNILELYDRGFSVRKIANTTGISRSSVKYRLVKELKIDYIPKRIFSNEWKEKIKTARAKQSPPSQGKSLSDLHRKRISDGKKGKTSDAIIALHNSSEWKEKLSIAKRGDKCYMWKGGITPIKKRLRGSFKWREWRVAVFKRDNYACCECGARNGNGKHIDLHPDHINPFSVILNNLKKQIGIGNLFEVALEYKPLWDVNNGRTMCVDCHKKTKTWGINQFTMGTNICV